MKECHNLKTLNNFQLSKLREHLSKHRWYLGEKNIQLNDRELEMDFIQKHFPEVCKDMRSEFCSKICEQKDACELSKMFQNNS